MLDIDESKTIAYSVRVNARAKSLRLTIYPDLRVVVTMPRGFPQAHVKQFVVNNSAWIERRLASLQQSFPDKLPPSSRQDYEKYKERARALVVWKIKQFNSFYGFTHGRVAIRNQSTRWGSCSRAGNLNFNYKIVLLSADLADYLIVHELCHLAEFNHSIKFWKLVSETISNYKLLRKQLRNI